MTDELRELYKYRDLLRQLVVRDLKVRYKNSVLGFFWSLANPMIQVATITIVFKYVMTLKIPNYSAYLLAAFLPWMFFQMTLLDSSQVILLHRDLLRKVYFPREVLPLSVVVSNLIHFLLAMVIFFAYVVLYIHFGLHGAGILLSMLWLPVLVVMQCLLVIGLTFFISCTNVFYEDTKYLVQALLGVLFYLTPVMYPPELVYASMMKHHLPFYLYRLYLLNPMNMLIVAYRRTLLPAFSYTNAEGVRITSLPMDYTMLAVCGLVCLLVAVAGYRFFISRKWIFPERV